MKEKQRTNLRLLLVTLMITVLAMFISGCEPKKEANTDVLIALSEKVYLDEDTFLREVVGLLGANMEMLNSMLMVVTPQGEFLLTEEVEDVLLEKVMEIEKNTRRLQSLNPPEKFKNAYNTYIENTVNCPDIARGLIAGFKANDKPKVMDEIEKMTAYNSHDTVFSDFVIETIENP